MKKPTDTEKIQLVAVLRVLDLSQDEVSSVLHVAKVTVVDTEKWIRTEDVQTVWDILEDNALRTTVVRELPSIKGEEVTDSILVRAPQVDRAAILAHYGRKVPEEDSEERLKRHLEDLCTAARQVLGKLYEYYAWPDDMTIDQINLERDDLKSIGLFRDELVIDLFEHLQNDIEELKPFTRWEDLTPKDINTNLLKLISKKTVNRDFGGKCRILLNDMKSKSQA